MEPDPSDPAGKHNGHVANQATNIAAVIYGLFIRCFGLVMFWYGVQWGAAAVIYRLHGVPDAVAGDSQFALAYTVTFIGSGVILIGCAPAIVRFSYPNVMPSSESPGDANGSSN